MFFKTAVTILRSVLLFPSPFYFLLVYRLPDICLPQFSDWMTIQYFETPASAGDQGNIYVAWSPFPDLSASIADGSATIANLPGPNYKNYTCLGSCAIEVQCDFKNGTYYIGVSGGKVAAVSYRFNVFIGNMTVPTLKNEGTPVTVLNAQRDTKSSNLEVQQRQRNLNYDFYRIEVDEFNEGSYLVVNISSVYPVTDDYPVLRLYYQGLPENQEDVGVLDVDDPINCVSQTCLSRQAQPFYQHVAPALAKQVACECIPQLEVYGGPADPTKPAPPGVTGSFQYTCNVTVSPCQLQYGDWYASVELPPRVQPTDNLDTSGRLNYTIQAFVMHPSVHTLERNVTFRGHTDPWLPAHYKIKVPFNEYNQGQDRFFVHVSNVVGGTLDVWVHQGLGPLRNLAGGPDACVPSNATCRTCDACNIFIERCHFTFGEWYISLNVPYENNRWLVEDFDRIPVTFTVRAEWYSDPEPAQLYAGTPVMKYIGAGLYDFYQVQVPETVDTWLFVELFVRQSDPEVALAMLHGEIPGGDCYQRPDFYCLTSDSRETVISTGPPQFLSNTAEKHRESCSFMIQTCELEAGPLYLSVYGSQIDYKPYGDTTFYDQPAYYTLWIDFDVASELSNGVAYSENVFAGMYRHYYIRADEVDQGSQLSVEITNIQNGIPPTVEGYVNFNFLAGDCPCHDYMFNCTPSNQPCNSQAVFNQPLEGDMVNHCCTILVPPCAFRPGVWYVSVLGVNENLVEHTTPIGYTLTATIRPPPPVRGLVLGQVATAVVPQWNTTGELVHYKLGARSIPLHDLKLRLSWPQSCDGFDRMASLSSSRDQIASKPDVLRLFVNKNNIASPDFCWDYMCEATIESDSYCEIIIPNCEWTDDDYFVSIQGEYDGNSFEARATLQAHVREVNEQALTLPASVTGHVHGGEYDHYYMDLRPDGRQYLQVDFYSNLDEDTPTLFLNVDTRAGDSPCYSWWSPYRCQSSSCSWQIEACDLHRRRYYLSVSGGSTGQFGFTKRFGGPRFAGFRDNWLDLDRSTTSNDFYRVGIHYTLNVQYRDVLVQLYQGNPIMATARTGEIHHYRYIMATPRDGQWLKFDIDNVRRGSVQGYISYADADNDDDDLAGECPCYNFDDTCVATGADCDGNRVDQQQPRNWCTLVVNSCQLRSGVYYYSVRARSTVPATPLPSPVGYTVEANVVTDAINSPNVVRGRNTRNTLVGERVANNRYNHYQFTTDDDDFGNQIIVEITGVQHGALQVYYQQDQPAQKDCALLRICNKRGLSRGKNCDWQLPYCQTRKGVHYVSVLGFTGRESVSYNILIYKQRPLSVIANPDFNPTDIPGTFDTRAELNVTHRFTREPNGWARFIKLEDVLITDRDIQGDILEVFFYRMQNNLGQEVAFNVYLWPAEPAGPRTCTPDCNANLDAKGSCQNFECQHHVPTTSSTDNQRDSVYSSTCLAGDGKGRQPGVGFPGPTLPCTITVWQCDLAHYQPANQPKDWWMTVIPVGGDNVPVNPSLNGLSYSVAWRVRNVRRSFTPTPQGLMIVGQNTLELDTSINQGYTQSFAVTGYQQWLSFKVSVSVDTLTGVKERLVIQTNFLNPTIAGAVYVQPFYMAGPLGCNTYYCPKVGVTDITQCASNQRYVNASCCLRTNVYYISVRNMDPNNGQLPFQFRITQIKEPATVAVKQNPLINDQLEIINDNGVQGENFDFYKLTIDETDYADHQDLTFWLKRRGTVDGPLTLYLRRGTEPGPYAVASEDFWEDPEACRSYQYTCTAVTPGDGCCSIQIPHCNIIAGDWYFSVYNPVFDFLGGGAQPVAPTPGYSVNVYFSLPPIDLTYNVPYTNSLTTCNGMYFHHRIRVTPRHIHWEDRTIRQSYYTRWLRFQVANVTGGPIDLFVNYDDTAGQGPEASCNCRDSIAVARNCDNTNNICVVDIDPCSLPQRPKTSPKLLSGFYYASIATSSDATYSLRATIEQQVYQPLAPVAYPSFRDDGDGSRFDFEWSFRPTVNQPFYYLFWDTQDAIEAADDDDDDLQKDSFMVGYLDVLSGAFDPNVKINVWRDDCTRWECTIQKGGHDCVIDAIELAPCSVKGGRYYARIENNVASQADPLPISFKWVWNSTLNQNLVNNVPVAQEVFADEYQEWFYEVDPTLGNPVGLGCTLTIGIESSYGQVEAWIRPDTFAGPGPDANQVSTSCNIDYCITTTAPVGQTTNFDEATQSCELFLDTCELESRGYWVGVRGVNQLYPPVITVPQTNATDLQILYEIQATQTCVQFTELQFGCPETVVYNVPPSFLPQQFYVDLQSINVGGLLRFSMLVPSEAFLANKVATLHVARNVSVGYSDSCPDNVGDHFEVLAKCEVTSATATSVDDRECTIELNQCDTRPGRYYIWADAPRGTSVVANRWDPHVHQVVNRQLYTASINGPLLTNGFNLPYRPNLQYYRVDATTQARDFFMRIRLFGIVNDGDAVTASVNSGMMPLVQSAINGNEENCNPSYFNSCPNNADINNDCFIDVTQGDLPQTILPELLERKCEVGLVFASADDRHFCGQAPPDYFFITVTGVSQACPLHAATYSLEVTTDGNSDRMKTDDEWCGSVKENDYEWLRIFPTSTPPLQDTILRVDVFNVPPGQQANLLIQDGSLPTTGVTGLLIPFQPANNLASAITTPDADGYGQASILWQCRYGKFRGDSSFQLLYRHDTGDDDEDALFQDDDDDDDDEGMYVGVYGMNDGDDSNNARITGNDIKFTLNATIVPVRVFNLTNAVTVLIDDDDDDTCPHPGDFYRYNVPDVFDQHDSFLEVTVRSPGDFKVLMNRGGIADFACADVDYCERTDDPNDDDEFNECKIHDFCNLQDDGNYYITVISQTNYSIKAETIDNTQTFELGEDFTDTVRGGQYKTYKVEIDDDDLDGQSRLVVDIGDADNGGLSAWLRRGDTPGPFTNPNGPGGLPISSACAINFEATFWERVVDFTPGCNMGFNQLHASTACLHAGTYYVTVRGNPEERNCRSIRFSLRADILQLGVDVQQVRSHHSQTDQLIDFYNVDRLLSQSVPRYRYYRLPMQFNNDEAFGQVRLLDVEGGRLRVTVNKNNLAAFGHAFFHGSRDGISSTLGDMVSGQRPLTNNRLRNDRDGAFFPDGGAPNYDYCETGFAVTSPPAAQALITEQTREPWTHHRSCAVWLDRCFWSRPDRDDDDEAGQDDDDDDDMFFAVEPTFQDHEDHPITYSFRADEFKDFRLLRRNDPYFENMHDDNWEYHFYAVLQPDQQSVVIRTQIESGQGVLVNVYDANCPQCAEYHRQVWCSSDFNSLPGYCDIEIPTRAAHPGHDDRTFYIAVYGKNATYGITYYRGLENCHSFHRSGEDEGLNFCKNLPYATWRWDDYSQLDKAAECLFEELYEHFRVQGCWSGVTPECNDTLRRFACYENFHRCDNDGFRVGTCRRACESVVYQCVNHFETVGLPAYNCSSHRYLNEAAGATCTGSREDDHFGNPFFDDSMFDNVDDILYKSDLSTPTSAAVWLQPSLYAMGVLLMSVALFVI